MKNTEAYDQDSVNAGLVFFAEVSETMLLLSPPKPLFGRSSTQMVKQQLITELTSCAISQETVRVISKNSSTISIAHCCAMVMSSTSNMGEQNIN